MHDARRSTLRADRTPRRRLRHRNGSIARSGSRSGRPRGRSVVRRSAHPCRLQFVPQLFIFGAIQPPSFAKQASAEEVQRAYEVILGQIKVVPYFYRLLFGREGRGFAPPRRLQSARGDAGGGGRGARHHHDAQPVPPAGFGRGSGAAHRAAARRGRGHLPYLPAVDGRDQCRPGVGHPLSVRSAQRAHRRRARGHCRTFAGRHDRAARGQPPAGSERGHRVQQRPALHLDTGGDVRGRRGAGRRRGQGRR